MQQSKQAKNTKTATSNTAKAADVEAAAKAAAAAKADAAAAAKAAEAASEAIGTQAAADAADAAKAAAKAADAAKAAAEKGEISALFDACADAEAAREAAESAAARVPRILELADHYGHGSPEAAAAVEAFAQYAPKGTAIEGKGGAGSIILPARRFTLRGNSAAGWVIPRSAGGIVRAWDGSYQIGVTVKVPRKVRDRRARLVSEITIALGDLQPSRHARHAGAWAVPCIDGEAQWSGEQLSDRQAEKVAKRGGAAAPSANAAKAAPTVAPFGWQATGETTPTASPWCV